MTEKEIWFRRKWYGWGWFPANWKGWAATLIYLALAICGSYFFSISGSGSSASWSVVYLLVLSFIFIGIAWKKGESPCWQWGRKK
ncbi:MAG: hypothetical protein WCF77_03900 [Minisyncoccia bacterium]